MIRGIRRLVYRLGLRPSHRNPLYSPSLSAMYAFSDGVARGIREWPRIDHFIAPTIHPIPKENPDEH